MDGCIDGQLMQRDKNNSETICIEKIKKDLANFNSQQEMEKKRKESTIIVY